MVKRHFWNGFIQEKIESVQQKINLATKDFEQLGRNLAQLHALQPTASKQFDACNSNTIHLADHLLMSTISWLGSCINTQAGPAADQYKDQIKKNFNWTERIGEIVISGQLPAHPVCLGLSAQIETISIDPRFEIELKSTRNRPEIDSEGVF